MLARFYFLAALIVPLLFGVLSQECNNETMRRCRNAIMDELSSNGRSDRNQADEQCRTLRQNFDCLLWQTSMCLDKSEQDSNRDAIMRSWRYMGSFCETQGNWYTKPCFRKEEVTRCEGLLSSRSSNSIDTASCRSYASFRDCVSTIVQGQCSVTDQALLGTYLMEKGGQRAWNCPRNSDPLIRNNPASASLADPDTRYTSISEVSYGRCSDESRYALQDCRENFQSSQKEAQTRNDSDMRNHKTCCAMVHYENCVTTLLEDRCGERGRPEARNIVSDMKSRYPYYNCNDHTMNECNGAVQITTTFLINVLVTLMSIAMFMKD